MQFIEPSSDSEAVKNFSFVVDIYYRQRQLKICCKKSPFFTFLEAQKSWKKTRWGGL